MTAKKGKGPKPGSDAWTDAVLRIRESMGTRQPFCGEAGGVKRNGWPCESVFVRGNGLCRMHGGNARRGALAGPWKNGRHSAFARILPARFRAAYEASLSDDNLLSLRSEIALADVRTYELLEQLSSGESGEAWSRAGVLADAIRTEAGADEPDPEVLRRLSDELAGLSEAGVGDAKKWREVREATEHRRKLSESERARLKELSSMISAEEALTIVARLVDIVMKHVTDTPTRAHMLYEIEALVGHNAAAERRARFMLGGGDDGASN